MASFIPSERLSVRRTGARTPCLEPTSGVFFKAETGQSRIRHPSSCSSPCAVSRHSFSLWPPSTNAYCHTGHFSTADRSNIATESFIYCPILSTKPVSGKTVFILILCTMKKWKGTLRPATRISAWSVPFNDQSIFKFQFLKIQSHPFQIKWRKKRTRKANY